jgi:Lantibiotic dehydratase, N terminus
MVHNFYQRFLWRVAGFPSESLEQFALDDLAAAILPSARTRAVTPWDVWWRRNGDSLAVVHQDRFNALFESLRARLATLVVASRFQSAVAYSSPAAAVRLATLGQRVGLPRRGRDKRLELLAIRYLQRFAMKCETAAGVGPVITGTLTSGGPEVEFCLTPGRYRPSIFLSYSMTSLLTDHARRTPGVLAGIKVRRKSGTTYHRTGVVVGPVTGVLRLGALAGQVLALTTRMTNVADLGSRLQCDPHELVQVVYALHRAGLLTDELDSVHNATDPLAALCALLGAAGGDGSALGRLLDVLARARGQWLDASPQDRAAILERVGDAARALDPEYARATVHRFYADHLPFSEDGTWPGSYLSMSRSLAEPLLAELEPVLRESLSVPEDPVGAGARAVTALCSDKHIRIGLSDHLVDLAGGPPAQPRQAHSGSLRRRSAHLITSPDVMIAARGTDALSQGDFQFILSESHSSIGCAGFATRVLEDQCDDWLADLSSFLSAQLDPHQPLMLTPWLRNKTSYSGVLPTVAYLEVGEQMTGDAETLGLDDLALDVERESCAVVSSATSQSYALLPGEGGSAEPIALLNWFRSPHYSREDRPGPRRTTGRVVEQRASWMLEVDRIPPISAAPFEIFAWAQSERARGSWPRWMFAHPRRESKPICIDMSNPFCCEELHRLARGSDGPLRIVEMFPSPDEFWATSDLGHHACELRFLYAAGC